MQARSSYNCVFTLTSIKVFYLPCWDGQLKGFKRLQLGLAHISLYWEVLCQFEQVVTGKIDKASWFNITYRFYQKNNTIEGSESESGSVMSDSLQPHGLYSSCNSPGQNTGVGSLSSLQGIFPTQGSNPGLPHGRRFYHLSFK